MKKISRLLHHNILLIFLILAVELLFLRLSLPRFFSLGTLLSFGRQTAITAILAIGMGIVLISGGIDLSLGAIVSMIGMVAATFMVRLNLPIPIVVLSCILLGGLLGAVNGFICAKVRIHPFILTTASAVIYRGAANILSNGMPIYGLPGNFLQIDKYHLFGIPVSVLILLMCLLMGNYLLKKTYLGKYIYAIGLDEKSAEYAGINSRQIKIIVYCISGFFYGIASILLLTRIGSAQPTAMNGIELDVLVAAAIGGIGFKGGRGHLLNIILGVFVMEIFGDTLIVFNVGEYYRSIFKGIVLLIALFADGALRNDRNIS
ncbi:ABC transporter permease [Sediminispirochaeta smaragdinae]|jgi:ribose transport system permease protein|uniref:Inner-membrane translocator n=1 Tax=Sediminispirochaeta smaragdinae (strain DSM 11293 / JCM 15392 / SEBR 4228) TaxID=573413 RepID=E1R301_SEDSS|nr:ABC transporter permease [Sediminispirochaeta smaragdinae]ADK81187.1 inner-membrane translocator [Sediminispirochaeta smaragdinae DSM 11293]